MDVEEALIRAFFVRKARKGAFYLPSTRRANRPVVPHLAEQAWNRSTGQNAPGLRGLGQANGRELHAGYLAGQLALTEYLGTLLHPGH
jgi:hypothetical protein